MQVCRVCGETKPLTAFHFRNDNGKYRTNCKPCRNTAEAVRRYGITLGDVEALKEAQDNKCAICGEHADDIAHASFKHNPLVIDHDHETGEIRGLLCPTCNSGLGHFQDSIRRLRAAVEYLS